jgi:TetR/AcrR family transcriptional regulator, multidrug resistance operon repressor
MTKRETILQTTLRLIAAQGITATPMSQIMEESGVATGTIYHHFKSKDEIINYLYTSKKHFFEEIAAEILADNELSFQNFSALFVAIFNYYIENTDVFYFFQHVSKSTLITEESIEKGKMSYNKIASFFQSGIDAKLFADINNELLIDLLHANICIFVEMVLTGKSKQENLNQIITYSWKGIQKYN